jgi:hypothetical protein
MERMKAAERRLFYLQTFSFADLESLRSGRLAFLLEQATTSPGSFLGRLRAVPHMT